MVTSSLYKIDPSPSLPVAFGAGTGTNYRKEDWFWQNPAEDRDQKKTSHFHSASEMMSSSQVSRHGHQNLDALFCPVMMKGILADVAPVHWTRARYGSGVNGELYSGPVSKGRMSVLQCSLVYRESCVLK